jgi:DNA-binding NarL/FixJ family response regulator
VTDQLCVLIADDNPVYRAGLRAQFEGSPVMRVAEATCAKEVVTLATELKPAVTLIDLRMPKFPGGEATFSGVEAIREILKDDPDLVIVALTMHTDDGLFIATIRAGARGYLLKDVDDTNIVELVTASARGSAVFSRRIADRLPDILSAAAPSSSFPELTPQQVNVLTQVAAGKGNDLIARALSLSPKTVSNYLAQIYARLGVGSRAELVALARDRGMAGQPQ